MRGAFRLVITRNRRTQRNRLHVQHDDSNGRVTEPFIRRKTMQKLNWHDLCALIEDKCEVRIPDFLILSRRDAEDSIVERVTPSASLDELADALVLIDHDIASLETASAELSRKKRSASADKLAPALRYLDDRVSSLIGVKTGLLALHKRATDMRTGVRRGWMWLWAWPVHPWTMKSTHGDR